MDFPAYVPAAVRTHLINILEGESLRGIPGYSGLLSEANQRLEAIEESLERKVICGEVEDLPNLRRQKVEASTHRDMLAGDVDCLLRLAHDPRMRDSFALLTGHVQSCHRQQVAGLRPNQSSAQGCHSWQPDSAANDDHAAQDSAAARLPIAPISEPCAHLSSPQTHSPS